MLPAKNHSSSPVHHASKRRKKRLKEVHPFRKTAPHWAGWAVVAVLTVGLIISFSIYIYNAKHSSKTLDDELSMTSGFSLAKGELVSYPGRNINYKVKFNHLNPTHLAVAKKVGVKGPLKDQADVNKHKNQLKRISTTKNYVVDDLDYSVPYLTPNAAKELDAICAEFADILERNNLPHYRPIVTSVLRTQESVKKLQRSGNVNSTTNSAHCYGTTFDITYARFNKKDSNPNYMSDENLKLVLGQALLNEQRAGRIYVKYEFKQACFHITSRQ